MRKKLIIASVLLSALCIGPAEAFGTLNMLGQHAEHQHITRIALADFGPLTINELAGVDGRFGGVGAPDNPFRGLVFSSEAHCDNGDYLPSPPASPDAPYPQTAAQAQAHLERCRAWMVQWLDRAVVDAAPLAEPNEEKTALQCGFVGDPGSAKCAVLADLGVAFHAAQDFYAHSNWVDQPAPGALSALNPPGLGQSGRAPWLDPRAITPFPAGLMTGCFGGVPESWFCGYDHTFQVRHGVLNKDEGPIGPNGATGPGDTTRGSINGNFERAIAAAIDDTRDKWAYFRERVLASYGPERGPRIICAVQSDDFHRCP